MKVFWRIYLAILSVGLIFGVALLLMRLVAKPQLPELPQNNKPNNIISNAQAEKPVDRVPIPFTEKSDDCSDQIREKLVKSKEDVLFCRIIGHIEGGNSTGGADLIFSVFKVKSTFGHDCYAGPVYLGPTETAFAHSPADCQYALDVENPAMKISSAYKRNLTGEIEFKFQSWGAECANEGFLLVNGSQLEQHEVQNSCMR